MKYFLNSTGSLAVELNGEEVITRCVHHLGRSCGFPCAAFGLIEGYNFSASDEDSYPKIRRCREAGDLSFSIKGQHTLVDRLNRDHEKTPV